MSKQDVLFELGCEELPSRAVLPLAQAFANGIQQKLTDAQISCGEITYYATPRRLAVWIKAVDECQGEQQFTRKGPAKTAAYDASGNPTPALLGFARACGVSIEEIQFKAAEKGEWAVVEKIIPGENTVQLLPQLFKDVLDQLPIAKPMFWGSQVGPFVRPVHWIVSLFGSDVMEGTYFGINAGRTTMGHRYHYPIPHVVNHPADYEACLQQLKVEPSFETRRARVLEAITKQAASKQCEVVINEELLDEVTSIVEWPVALTCTFPAHFLRVPQEVLIASMQAHQKCFALRDAQGKLTASFITVANIESSHPDKVVVGNEKVMRARLSDADFFFTQDSKHPLDSFKPMLDQALFQAKLGSLADQTRRIACVLPQFFEMLKLDAQIAHRALELSKTDLMTGMVGEFPELQGVMGYYYALQAGEDPTAALAIKEQYLPRFSLDELPSEPLGWVLSLLNRLDTLVGIFGIGQKPTGMKDPYKLRRHALAVIRLLAQFDLPLNLSDLLKSVFDSFPKGLLSEASLAEVKTFILERLPAFFAANALEAELVLSVTAVQSDCIYDLMKRAHALQSTRADIQPLIGGVKRVHHLLKGVSLDKIQGNLDTALFEDQAEKGLYEALSRVEANLTKDYEQNLLKLSELRPEIDAFFDSVMVMVDNDALKMNRLKLLYRLQRLLLSVADLSLG